MRKIEGYIQKIERRIYNQPYINPMPPSYTLEEIRFATDPQTFEKAVGLYESGKVTKFKEGIRSYSAVVIGSKPYNVSGEARRFDYGNCDCYLGQNDE